MELLIGCGKQRTKQLVRDGRIEWSALTTLDITDVHQPDVVHDLCNLPLPFADDTFDEIHAYEVLEHTGQQGDWRFFFAQFSDFWRILKPGGMLFGTSPAPGSAWAWGDPGHTRIISKECLTFLAQPSYTAQVGITPMTDYRFCYKADFQPVLVDIVDASIRYALEAIKPSRITP